MTEKKEHNKLITTIIDFLPLAVFFILNKNYGIMNATAALVVLTIICLSINYAFTNKVSVQALVGAVLVALFGSLTIMFDNEVFIKLKPTIVNIVFGSIIFVGIALNKNFIKMIMQSAIQMEEKGWNITAKLWGSFFFFLAFLNELAWRNLTTDQWVNFKVFGVTVVTFLFSAYSLYVTYKYIKKDI